MINRRDAKPLTEIFSKNDKMSHVRWVSFFYSFLLNFNNFSIEKSVNNSFSSMNESIHQNNDGATSAKN